MAGNSPDEYSRQGKWGFTMQSGLVSPAAESDALYRTLIGASPNKPLAPILSQIRPYIDGTTLLTPMQQGMVISHSNNLIDEHRLPIGHTPSHDSVREYLRQFAAGLQFVYE